VTAVEPGERHHAAASIGDRRGLTAAGGVGIAVLLGLAGGAYDVLTGSGLRLVFAVAFIAGCALAALLVHTEDLLAAVIMPPLVYLLLAFIGAVVERRGQTGSFFAQQTLEMANSLILDAPVLLIATGLALIIAGVRALLGRRRRTA
jgi:hypothetical protein